MKIAVIVAEFPCISETFILNQITALLDAGHQVTIIALKERPADIIHENVIAYKLIKQTKYLKVISGSKIKKRLSVLLKALYYGFRFPIPMFKAIKYLLRNHDDFYINLYFLFIVIGQKYEIYHFHFGNIGKLGVFLKKVGLPGKMITSFHGYDINQIPLQKGEHYYKELFETGEYFVANSEFTRQQMIKYGCSEAKISIIPVGLHINEYPYKERHFSCEGPVEILTIGRLVEKKGYEYSIQAIAGLIKEGFNIHYTIAGNGVLRGELETLVVQLGISKCVTFTGEITQREVVRLYGTAHLFVLASVTASDGDKEGQGLVLQEAQACGIPVISTLHNGIPDGVLDGQSGILVPEKDVDSLIKVLRKLILDPSTWLSMGKAGREFVEAKYDMNVIVEQLVKLYKS